MGICLALSDPRMINAGAARFTLREMPQDGFAHSVSTCSSAWSARTT
jgi:hypothetical protein